MIETVREISVFIASPDDVKPERALVEATVTRLNGELKAFAKFRAIRWENEFYRAHATFQTQIPEPSHCDLVIVILGDKLGTPLPADTQYLMDDGTAYPSGTAYELLSSIAAADLHGKPDVYVFRRSTEPVFAASDRLKLDLAVAEKARLDSFFTTHFRTEAGAFKRSINDFTDTDDFERKAGKLLRGWADEAFSLRPTWDVELNGSPFRALEPFDARHAAVYFGRDRKVQRAVDELGAAARREGGLPFLLVVGPSGAGKSSLARAGVIPRLRQSGLFAPVDLCRVAVMKPGESKNAFDALATALFNDGSKEADPGGYGAALPELAEGEYGSAATLGARFAASPEQAAAPIVAALQIVGKREGQSAGLSRDMQADLLLLVDQVEELFARPEAERIGFAGLLLALAESRRVWIVATLRADLYDSLLDPSSKLLELKDKGGSYDLASPGPAEIEEILDRSAVAAGLIYETHPVTGERLDRALQLDAEGKDALPLLQFSLDQLFHKRVPTGAAEEGKSLLTFASYEELGRLDGAIDLAAEKALARVARSVDAGKIDDVLARLLRALAQTTREGASAAAWTTRPTDLKTAARGTPQYALAEALAENRLLVFDRAGAEQTQVRLAHDRVLTSWARAAKILHDEHDFFRVRYDVESEWRRWKEHGQRRDFLLRGLPLDSAQAMDKRYAAELSADMRFYIAASRRRDQLRRGGVATAAVVFGVVALVASAAGFLAVLAEHKSSRNFEAAKAAADQLATSIAPRLRDRKDISVDTLDIVFGLTDKLIGGIEATASQQEGLLARSLQQGFAKIDMLLGGAAPRDDAADLTRTHSNMDYQFAETYHRTARNLPKALERASEAVTMLQSLVDHGDRSTATLVPLALSRMEASDLLRQQIEDASRNPGQGGPPAAPPDFTPARVEQVRAMEILDGVFRHAPDRADWGADYAKALTGLGDLERKRSNIPAAIALYDRARAVAIHLARLSHAAPDEGAPPPGAVPDAAAERELAWAWRKTGEVQDERHQFAEAERTYAEEICIRRGVFAQDSQRKLISEDLPFALLKLGDAALHVEPPHLETAADAYDEALVIRRELVAGDNLNPKLYVDFVTALKRRAQLEQRRNDPSLAATFTSAADDITAQIPVVTFNPESETNADKRRDRMNEAAGKRNGGVTALIEPDRRRTIELDLADFTIDRLPKVSKAAENCWASILQQLPADPWAKGAAQETAAAK